MRKSVNAIERVKMVKAMEFICRQINDEEIFECEWLTDGVADGDIVYGDLFAGKEDAEILEYYIKDDHFAELMTTFLFCMRKAWKSGGLFCDDVVNN